MEVALFDNRSSELVAISVVGTPNHALCTRRTVSRLNGRHVIGLNARPEAQAASRHS